MCADGRATIGVPFEFPSVCPAINAATLHPRAIALCRQLLDVGPGELRLTMSQLLTRTGPPADAEAGPEDLYSNAFGQRIHADNSNATLLAPPPFSQPEVVQCLLYLNDEEECGGPTAVVPRTGPDDEAYVYDDRRVSPGGAPPFIWTNDQGQTEAHYRAHHPEIAAFRQRLYEREMHVSPEWPQPKP